MNKKEECYLIIEPSILKNRQCCCVCKFLIPDYSHPWIDEKPISNQKGWICTIDLGREGAFSGWPQHSIGCEMFTKRKDK